MTITAFDHYTIRCADLQASWRFYADVLGLRVVERSGVNVPAAEFRARLSERGLAFTERTLPAAAKHLLVLKDPDRVEVELAFALDEAPSATQPGAGAS